MYGINFNKKLLCFVITDKLIAVYKIKFIVLFIVIFGTRSFAVCLLPVSRRAMSSGVTSDRHPLQCRGHSGQKR